MSGEADDGRDLVMAGLAISPSDPEEADYQLSINLMISNKPLGFQLSSFADFALIMRDPVAFLHLGQAFFGDVLFFFLSCDKDAIESR